MRKSTVVGVGRSHKRPSEKSSPMRRFQWTVKAGQKPCVSLRKKRCRQRAQKPRCLAWLNEDHGCKGGVELVTLVRNSLDFTLGRKKVIGMFLTLQGSSCFG